MKNKMTVAGRGWVALLTTAVAVNAAMAVRADTVTMGYSRVDPNAVVGIHSATPSENVNVYAGAYRHNLLTPPPSYFDVLQDGRSSVPLFCADVRQNVEPAGGAVYTVRPTWEGPRPTEPGGNDGYPMGIVRAEWLSVLAYDYWTTSYLENGEGASISNSTVAERYAALQVAIWEMIFEGNPASDIPADWNVSNTSTIGENDFYINNGRVADEANGMLNAVQAHGLDSGHAFLAILTNDTYQDMLVRTTVDAPWLINQVPEPTALLLAGFGLMGLLNRRNRRA